MCLPCEMLFFDSPVSASPFLLNNCLGSQCARLHCFQGSSCGGVHLPNNSYLFVNLELALEGEFCFGIFTHACVSSYLSFLDSNASSRLMFSNTSSPVGGAP